jgi:hypothetical protein
VESLCPYKLDGRLYAFDRSLGPSVNLWIAQLCLNSHRLGSFIDGSYHSLPVFMGIIFGAQLSLASRRFNIFKLVLINSAIGFSLYLVYPAAGPKYALPGFPGMPETVPMRPVLLDGLPNAMPSLHVGLALLVFFLARPWKWLRWIGGGFLMLTVICVFGTGEHYEVDVIVALPYALAVLALASKVKERTSVLWAAGGMVALWLLVLRFGAFPSFLSWGMVLTTVAAGLLMERRLARSLWPLDRPHLG